MVGPNGVVTTLAGNGNARARRRRGPRRRRPQLRPRRRPHLRRRIFDRGHAEQPDPQGLGVGMITTVGGNGRADTAATAARPRRPRSTIRAASSRSRTAASSSPIRTTIAFDGSQSGGVITTVRGHGAQGFAGDGGPATAAQLSIPFGVAPTADGGFLIVDVGNQRIRKVSAAGTISTVAGNGVAATAGRRSCDRGQPADPTTSSPSPTGAS